MSNKKKLIIFEINEFDFNFFLYGSKKYKYPEIQKFLELKKFQTITLDKKEGYNLDPWVQWVSVHTGKTSKEHKVFRIGQKLNTKIKQVWEVVSKKYKITIWGLFNSNLRTTQNIDLFYPDPWSYTQNAYPRNLNSFLSLPKYYAKNYTNLNIIKVLIKSLNLFKYFFLPSIISYLLKNFLNLFIIFFKSGLKSFNLYFFFDLLSLLIIKQKLNRNTSDLTIINLNSFAHYQHNYWNIKKFEKIYFWYLNQMIIQMKNILLNYENYIVFNGFSQKKVNLLLYPQIKSHKLFFENLNIKYSKYEPNMTNGGTIFFNNSLDKRYAIKTLSELAYKDKRLFNISNFKNQNKIFYSINIVFDKSFNFKEINKLKKKNIINNKIIFNKILKNLIFRQSTSRHIPYGKIFFSKKIKLKNNYFIKNYFYNQKLFNLIIDIFNK
jgi:hypothetical protein